MVTACVVGMPLLAQPEPQKPSAAPTDGSDAKTPPAVEEADSKAADAPADGDGKPDSPDAKPGAKNENEPAKNAAADTQGDESDAAEGEDKADDKSAAGAAALEKARSKLIAYDSIQAKIRQRVTLGVEMNQRSFTATGTYLQGPDLKLRLQFQLEVGKTKGSLLEVCDGQVLWARYLIGDSVRITRRDVREILKAAATSSNVSENLLIAELGLGGLPALTASLERSIDFNQVTRETIDDREFTVIEGGWKPEYRKRWTDPKNPDGPLPAQIPDRARLYLDENDFPLRIVYLKKHPNRDVMMPMVSIEFEDVVLNGRVSPDEFSYVPPAKPVPQDVTEAFKAMLKQSAELKKARESK